MMPKGSKKRLVQSESGSRIEMQVEAAQAFLERGWTPIPVIYRTKRAVNKRWTEASASLQNINEDFGRNLRNVGFLTGPKTGGPIDIDIDGADVRALIIKFLPPTNCKFGREGRDPTHYLYESEVPKTIQFQDPIDKDSVDGKRGMIVELRSNRSFTVGPGSIHENNERVIWEAPGVPAKVDAGELTSRTSSAAACALLARHFPGPGGRHNAMLALTGFLVQRGWESEEVKHFAEAIADHNQFTESDIPAMVDGAKHKLDSEPLPGMKRLKEFWSSEVVDKAMSWLKIKPERASRQQNDISIAADFVSLNYERVRYIPQRKKWIWFTGKIWKLDDREFVKSLVRDHLVASNPEGDVAMGSNHKINSVIAVASLDARIIVDENELDRNPDYIGTPMGVLDLKKMEMVDCHSADIVTRSTTVAPDFRAKSPIWDSFIDQITSEQVAERRFLARWCGYCVTGHVREQVMLILFGSGQNGKSILQNVLSDILGDYSCVAPDNMFVEGARPLAPIEMKHIENSRVIIASEPDVGKRWNESAIKRVTGGDGMYSRGHYVEGRDFIATGKILMSANELPLPKTTEFAMRRRILINEMKFRPNRVDDRLSEKLKLEYPAIFAWMLRGTTSWYNLALSPPPLILTARENYFDSHDWIARWLKECAVAMDGHFERNQRIEDSFRRFMVLNQQAVWSQQAISKALLGKGFDRDNSRNGGEGKARGFRGLKVVR